MIRARIYSISCLLCLAHQATCHALPSIPEAVKNAASVMFTTITKTPQENSGKEPHAEELPISPACIFATFTTATLTTTATNSLFQSTRMYHALDKTAKFFARKYTKLPKWACRKIMPATSLVASTAFSTLCFLALHSAAQTFQKAVEESYQELKDAKEKRPEQ